jgi:hypothetical protein
MSSNIHPFYSHSGKFGLHGPILALAAGVIVAFPLGIIYSYLIKWIPFIYLNMFITIGYGFAFGLMTGALMKFAKVRNLPVALVTGLAVGLFAWWGSWNGCARALIGSRAPWILTPHQMSLFIKVLYQEGSWGIGFSSSAPVTGVLLAIFWLVEGAVIVGLCTFASYLAIARTPFCELHDCWLSKEKKIDKLDAFVRPEHLEAFKAGDITPLDQSQPRVPASGRFARLTLKHSDTCHDFCTLSIANVTLAPDKKGNLKEKEEELMTNLLVPKSMFDYLSKFDHPTAAVPMNI